ncbi:MAG: peptidoglycan DD-metalloendopeptidase family protein [Alphaproteobacteria bacterium]|nr:peptidoglycan DD-metalloendopeptidase family protein [Alphaproteobacteria bacterium]MBN2675035.1 peptidoglycan DD-metalloendopeptidase family protein [Alphaproteobacteria bacterium]
MKFISFSIFFILSFSRAFAASELAQINSQIQKTEQQNKIIEQKVKSSDRDIEQTKKKLVKAADKVITLEEQRAVLARKILQLDTEHDRLDKSLSENKERISDAAATILFISSRPSFDSENMHDYVLTSSILSGASQRFDSEMQNAIKQIKELEKIREERALEKEKLDRTAEKYAKEKKDLDKLLHTRASQNEKLKNQQYTVQQKLRDLSDRAKNISELSAGVGSSEMSEDSRLSGRKMNSPVRGRLVVHFGEKTALGLESNGWRIRVRGNSLVVAPADGVIKFADNFRGFGKIVIMSHKNGYNTVMTNLGSLDALVGQEVLAGEPIGRMDPDKPEMYLEVRRGIHTVNPARLFKEP